MFFLVLFLWVGIEVYKLYLDSSNKRIICKQIIAEIILKSTTVSNSTDTVDAHRLVCEALSMWSTLERLMPIYARNYTRVHEVLLAQHEHLLFDDEKKDL
jgi:hypothetical protein